MSPEVQGLIRPDWPAPARVRALVTTRACHAAAGDHQDSGAYAAGASVSPWDSFNLATHVGDDPDAVAANRRRLAGVCGVDAGHFGWLDQVHGADVVPLPVAGIPAADASVTTRAGQVCVVLMADCLPVLFCTRDGTAVAAAHAGWRGLAAGVLENTLAALGDASEVIAWLGPAIGPRAFEVGPEVREAFLARTPRAADCFRPSAGRRNHYFADLYGLARLQLQEAGVTEVCGGGYCTHTEAERFYSYRRDGRTGRMAALIWLTDI